MRINEDYMRIMRSGRSIEKHTYRKQEESAGILVFAIFIALGLLFLMPSCARSEEIPEDVAIKCLIGEASNQGLTGMTAVGEVLRRRGSTRGVYGCKSGLWRSEPGWVWQKAKKAWRASQSSNYTKGATLFENVIDFGKPSWYNCAIKTAQLGNHTFFKEIKPCKANSN